VVRGTVTMSGERIEKAVRYDPANPGNAALENPRGWNWVLLAIVLACLAIAG
jgi:hypothetical protein